MTLMVDPGALQPRKKRFTFRLIFFIIVVAGVFLGIAGSLVEATMKEPYKLAFDCWAIYRGQVLEAVSKSFGMFWFGVSNFKLYYFFVGLLFLTFSIVLALMTLGIVAGAFIGGAFYWILSVAQP